MHSRPRSSRSHQRNMTSGPGLSGSSRFCRCPLSPTTPESTTTDIRFTVVVNRLHHRWKAGHSRVCHEAERVHACALRLTSSLLKAPHPGSLRRTLESLHGERIITMISTLQLTRNDRLCLTHQRCKGEDQRRDPLRVFAPWRETILFMASRLDGTVIHTKSRQIKQVPTTDANQISNQMPVNILEIVFFDCDPFDPLLWPDLVDYESPTGRGF